MSIYAKAMIYLAAKCARRREELRRLAASGDLPGRRTRPVDYYGRHSGCLAHKRYC